MAGPAGKGDLRGAAERIERGIERYGEGDLVGALVEFEAALTLHPVSARGRQYAAWVRDLQSGKRRLDGGARGDDTLDEDALRAVNEALEDPPVQRPSAAETTLRGLQPPVMPTPPAGSADDDEDLEVTIARERVPTPVPRERIPTPPPPTVQPTAQSPVQSTAAAPPSAQPPPEEDAPRPRAPTLERVRSATPAPPAAATISTIDEPTARGLTPASTEMPRRGRLLTPTPPPPTEDPRTRDERARKPTLPPPAAASAEPPPSSPPGSPQIGTAPTLAAVPTTTPDRQRRLTPAASDSGKELRPPTPKESGKEAESPWDPVPLTPRGSEIPPEVRRSASPISSAPPTSSAPTPPPLADASSATIMGMPPLAPRLLAPDRKRARLNEDSLEPVTREFRSTTPTGPGLRPLDVPELTDEQIQGLLALDSPLLPPRPASPDQPLERIDYGDDSIEQRLVEMEADATPLPTPAPPELFPRRDDTNPMAMNGFESAEFDPAQLTPTGVKPSALKPVRVPEPEDDPYADLDLLPLEGPVDIGSLDDAESEAEEGGTNPTNPFIRGQRLAEYTSFANESKPEGDSKVDELPPLPTLPGARRPKSPLAEAEAALNAGHFAAAVDECERVLAATGGLTGNLAALQLPLVEQIYGAMLEAPERIPVHGEASANLDPRSAFLLSRIDGSMTVEDVLDVSGMPRLEALRGLALLVRRGAVLLK